LTPLKETAIKIIKVQNPCNGSRSASTKFKPKFGAEGLMMAYNLLTVAGT
jgi:hypothetical protein